MIVRRTPSGSRHVTQADHARFGADLLRLFRLPELAGHPRRELLLRAIGEHDNGWWEADAAPYRAADGRAALDFRDVPGEARREIWRRGIERFADESPHLAALVATHALRLSERFRDEPAWSEFRTGARARRDELLQGAGVELAAAAADDYWLELADGLSLAVCTGETGLFALPGWQIALRERSPEGEVELGVAPFPLAGATRFELSCRVLAPGRYESDAAFGFALATTPWQRLGVRCAPL